jgi:hypothetical protein
MLRGVKVKQNVGLEVTIQPFGCKVRTAEGSPRSRDALEEIYLGME